MASCLACTEGKECIGVNATPALSDVSGDCPVGFYCASDEVNKKQCPAGTYCPIGSSYPTNCPIGTYNDLPEKSLPADCKDCTVNKYCGERGINSMSSAAAQNCGDGFVCVLKAMYAFPSATQGGGFCPEG